MNDENSNITNPEYDEVATEQEYGQAPEAPKVETPQNPEESSKGEENSETSNATRVSVTIDTPWEDILNYDQLGKVLVFGAGKKGPPYLTDEQRSQLSAVNRERYDIVQEAMSATNDDEVMDEIQELIEMGETAIYARALDRLKIWNKDPRFEYVWSAPHNIDKRQSRGYVLAKNGPEETMFQQADGTHRIGDKGSLELVLMKTPKEVKAMEKNKRRQDYEKARLRNEEQVEGTPIWKEDEALEKKKGYRYRPITR